MNTNILASKLSKLDRVSVRFDGVHFHEVVMNLPIKAKDFIKEMASEGFDAGFDLGQFDKDLQNCLMICSTEIHNDSDHDEYVVGANESVQGTLECMYDLQELTGMTGVSLAPMAGAQGEFAGVSMIKAYHHKRGDFERDEIIVPDAAHGTNLATAKVCGLKVIEIPTKKCGDIDIEALEKVLGPKTAGIMLTNPSTVGVFERNIGTIAKMVHKAGSLLYYDGANLNAIMGKACPGDMGFDVLHMNLHKTFATPHGGSGPGAGPVAVNDKLKEFLPIPNSWQKR